MEPDETLFHDFVCTNCGGGIMVTQGIDRDYLWWCSSVNCPHHHDRRDQYDDEDPPEFAHR